MLSKKEKMTMQYLYSLCNGKTSVLVSPSDIQNALASKYEVEKIEIDDIMDSISLEGYITLIMSDKKGKPIYCVSLTHKGEGYTREVSNKKKGIVLIITRTIL